MGLFNLFGGRYPSTKKYEAKQQQLASDYERFKELAVSEQVKRFDELNKIVNSAEFKKRVDVLKNQKFSSTDAYRKEVEYKRLRKSGDIKRYNKFVAKGNDKRIEEILASKEYARYQELRAVVETPAFKQKQKGKGFKNSEDYQLLVEYQQLQKSSDIKFAIATTASADYKNYKQLKNSDRLQKFEALAAYISSPDFINFKAEIEDPKRYKKSEEASLANEFDALSKSNDIVWYKKNLAANTFAEVKKWKLVFEDNFDGVKLDTNKWQSGYYWGNQLLGDSYSPLGELQTYKKENISILNSVATLQTTKTAAKGKVWDPKFGFVDGNFDYTSALINTGASFRQQYGRFEFKVKMSNSAPVTHNIWMVGKTSAPHINVVNFGLWRKKVAIGLVTEQRRKLVEVDGAKFNSDFYIFSLLWTPEKLVWSINGVEVQTITTDVPRQEMYLVLSSNVHAKSNVQNAALEIDWVRAYTWNNDNEGK